MGVVQLCEHGGVSRCARVWECWHEIRCKAKKLQLRVREDSDGIPKSIRIFVIANTNDHYDVTKAEVVTWWECLEKHQVELPVVAWLIQV